MFTLLPGLKSRQKRVRERKHLPIIDCAEEDWCEMSRQELLKNCGGKAQFSCNVYACHMGGGGSKVMNLTSQLIVFSNNLALQFA